MAIDVGREQDLGLAHARGIGALDADDGTTANGHALHEAPLRIIIVDGVVLRRTVVPHGYRVRGPAMPELIFGNERLMEECVEQRPALTLIHILDGDCELR